ncbi:MAG: EamA family transporter [Calditrichaeota bacterium]|nr:MAG: EamA family transporter [Calditrichota bacterium]MBL1205263.1 EamA family transporter [Calditrichota bacterium]NOG45092.1 EamA family transporter [Calditrichota bacterium]
MNRFAPLFVVFAASLWGIDGILLRPNLYTLPVPLVVFLESTIIVLVLSLFFVRSYKSFFSLKRNDWLAFFGVAIMGGAIGTMSITKALFYVNFVNLSIVVLIQKLQPAFAIMLASLILKETPPKKFYGWAALAITGAYFMTFGLTFPEISFENKTALAAGFALLATLGFASSTVLSKRALKNLEFNNATYLRFLSTAIVMLIIVLSTGNISAVSQVSTNQWLIFISIAFLTGGPGIFLYYYGLKHIKASVATIAELAFPITAVLLEFFIRGNILGPVQWIGLVVLFYSILKVTRLEKG